MSPEKKRALTELLSLYSIPALEERIDFSRYFEKPDKVILEIGFGMGEELVKLSEQFIDKSFIGIEVHRPGVARLLGNLHKHNIRNVRVIMDDAVPNIRDRIPKESIEGIHIFFPDPWPKKRHHKRRLITPELLGSLIEILKPQGYIYIVTDWEDYAKEILSICSANKGINNKYQGFAERIEWRPETSFERKGLDKKHNIFELFFIKK